MNSSRHLYRIVINLFLVATVLAFVATIYLTVSRATVTVPGDRERFTASAQLEARDAADAEIPATFLQREYELSDTFPVGTATTTSDKAGGIVSIVNNYSRSQSLVKITRIISPDGKLFRITESVNVPAGGKVDVFAEADLPGDSFLIGPSKFTIPGLWEGIQSDIYAESSKPMSYERPAQAVVNESDLTKAETVLTERIIGKALDDFRNELKDISLNPDDLISQRVTVGSEPKLGTQVVAMKVTARRTVSVVRVDKDKMAEKTGEQLKTQLPDPERFIELIPDSLSFTIDSVVATEKRANLTASISAWIRSKETAPALDVQKIAGHSIKRARTELERLGFTDAHIRIFPSWSPWMPLLADHITVQVK